MQVDILITWHNSLQVDDELIAELDSIVASGEAESRSDAVRRALEAMIDQRRRRLVGEAIAEGYRRVPETDEELGRAIESTRSMIAEEPR
jgi:metal-responsive CopG/Arc/MetJ family transcriptional regulator